MQVDVKLEQPVHVYEYSGSAQTAINVTKVPTLGVIWLAETVHDGASPNHGIVVEYVVDVPAALVADIV